MFTARNSHSLVHTQPYPVSLVQTLTIYGQSSGFSSFGLSHRIARDFVLWVRCSLGSRSLGSRGRCLSRPRSTHSLSRSHIPGPRGESRVYVYVYTHTDPSSQLNLIPQLSISRSYHAAPKASQASPPRSSRRPFASNDDNTRTRSSTACTCTQHPTGSRRRGQRLERHNAGSPALYAPSTIFLDIAAVRCEHKDTEVSSSFNTTA